ncbi:MAG TPA: capsule biosynthesis GfcC D2 domain-containing protein [Pseudidiomarina sp.]|nr:capsule biosynthesis GfcC D2 domain-containing protein [Pseudidiomarina sp.]
MRSLCLVILMMLAIHMPSSAAQTDEQTVVTLTIGQQTYQLTERPRLSQVYQLAQLPAATYWPATRLVSQAKQQEIRTEQTAVVNDLIAMSAYYRDFGEYDVAESLRQLAAQVRQWPLVGAENVGITLVEERSDMQPGYSYERPSLFSSAADTSRSIQHNPLLPAGSYQLLYPPSSTTDIPWRVVGMTQTGQVQIQPYNASLSVRQVLQAQHVFSRYQQLAHVVLVDLTGQLSEVPVAYYNQTGLVAPYGALLFVEVPSEWLVDRYQGLNERLRALVRYWNPIS